MIFHLFCSVSLFISYCVFYDELIGQTISLFSLFVFSASSKSYSIRFIVSSCVTSLTASAFSFSTTSVLSSSSCANKCWTSSSCLISKSFVFYRKIVFLSLVSVVMVVSLVIDENLDDYESASSSRIASSWSIQKETLVGLFY